MKKDPVLKENARLLRRGMSPAETILWRELRGRRFVGFKFRRQHPIGSYILDFYCAAIHLAIELDGESHLTRESEDVARDTWLSAQGVQLLRYWNTQLYDERDAVMEAIWRACQERTAGI